MKSINKLTTILCWSLALAIFSVNATTDDNENQDDWADDWTQESSDSALQLSGFVEAAHGQFLQSNVIGTSSSINELRARLNLEYNHASFDFNAKADALYDAVLSKTLWQTRELNISASPFASVDVKIGRQILTWGTGDYLFLNDLFPKDWQSFFSGRADEYLKAPSDSIRASWFIQAFTLDIAWTTAFSADKYITGERFSFYSPQQQRLVAPITNADIDKTDNEQWSARVTTHRNSIEYAAYASKGNWPTPLGINALQQGYFPKLNTWGLSALGPLMGGIFKLEYAHYNSIDDNQGDDATIANGQQRLLLGYEREAAKNLTASMQYYIEKTKHYDAFITASTLPKQQVSQYRQLLTFRLSYRAWQQSLTTSLFTFYSPSANDGYIKTSLAYRHDDHWLVRLGANYFFGQDKFSFFGQHQDNSNAWLSARYQF